ncbi:arginine--tRNA ligase [Virgisporangium aurantiacum]|uniref:arginine--tRNA ligase n=1 Tax=Virgisporangium aurantiacum TaxID=175570 RepID=UPI00194DCA62|nr:arginine--tRNA ligase [Virgisporangium aurantiacum]
MTPAELAALVRAAASTVLAARGLDLAVLPASTNVERPRNPEHGDYASNIALQLAKPTRTPPRELATAIAEALKQEKAIKDVDIAGPGFLNIRLSAGAAGELARVVVTQGKEYGNGTALSGQNINLEFVSANPTGPVHLGHTRWAAVGDSLGRIFEAAGARVTREHYTNDAGAQLERFGRSLYAAARNEPTPEDGYGGEYVKEIADKITGESEEDYREQGYRLMLAEMQKSLERFNVHFDVWFSERALHEGGAVEHAIDVLRKNGHIFEKDGATWLRTTDFTDDKDRVIVRSNGEKTYFAADCAYYINKRERGFDRCLYLLGADHHGYIGRLKAIAACAGDDPEKNIQILIGQLVNLMRGGEPVRLSKRAGTIITLDELVDAVGVDAARYSLARSSTDSPLTLDIEEITRQAPDNPVFYVQYAHARISSLLRNAQEMNIDKGELKTEQISHEKELDLLKALGEFPRVVATAAELCEPHRVARYLEELATTYHRFYDNCRVLPRGDEEVTDLTRARLWLVEAARIVLANGLALLGVSAPERM